MVVVLVVVLVVVEVVDVLVVLVEVVEVLLELVDVVGGIVVVVVEDDVDAAAEATPVLVDADAVSSRRSSTGDVPTGAPEGTVALHALPNRSTASPNARRSNIRPTVAP